jgi:hypothetical protein
MRPKSLSASVARSSATESGLHEFEDGASVLLADSDRWIGGSRPALQAFAVGAPPP